MPEIRIASTERLQSLDSALAQSAQTIRDALPAIRAKAQQAKDTLEGRQSSCRSHIDYWQGRIDSADEDENTEPYYRQIEKWEGKLDEVRSWLGQIESAQGDFQAHANRLETLANHQTSKARASLRQTIESIDEYASYHPPGLNDGEGGISLGGSSPTADSSLGYRRDRKDPADWLWINLYDPPPLDFPTRTNLESMGGLAYDQGKTPQCVCFSMVCLKHIDLARDSGEWIEFDPAPIYALCKARDGSPGEDGTTIRDAFKVSVKQGLVSRHGPHYFVRGYARLQSVDEIRQAVTLGKPVMLGVKINQIELSRLDRTTPATIPISLDEGHCMVVVGYDDAMQALRVRNSWGVDWADCGHCWLPYGYLTADPDFDAWTSVCEKVGAPPKQTQSSALPNREISTSNFAWFNPADITLLGADGPQLEWNRITRQDAGDLLQRIVRMRPYIPLAEIKSHNENAVREKLVATRDPAFSDEDMKAFDLFFKEPIRIDLDGQGRFMVVNGRHRLYQAGQMAIQSVPVSISNGARKALKELILRDPN